MPFTLRAALVTAALPLLGLAQATPPATTVTSGTGSLRVETLATLEFPWGMAALPDGRLLITEKPGRLRIFDNGKLSAPIEGVPKPAIANASRNRAGCSMSPSIRISRRTGASISRIQSRPRSSRPIRKKPATRASPAASI
jgi:glucose/arabinose dehydrogenase